MGEYRMRNKEFEDISIPKWKLSGNMASGKVYRVFKNATEFETVEAESAKEAISKCGLKSAFMIKPGAMDEVTLIDQSMLLPDTSSSDTPPPAIA